MLGALLKKKSEAAIIKEFDEKIIQEGRFPPRFLDNLKQISKTKTAVEKAKGNKGKKKDNLTTKQSRDVDNARKLAVEITDALVEYTQRCELASMEKSRFIIKGKTMEAEVFFLPNTFIIQNQKIQKISGEKLVNATPKELQEQLTEQRNKETKIDFNAIKTLKKIFGEFDLVY